MTITCIICKKPMKIVGWAKDDPILECGHIAHALSPEEIAKKACIETENTILQLMKERGYTREQAEEFLIYDSLNAYVKVKTSMKDNIEPDPLPFAVKLDRACKRSELKNKFKGPRWLNNPPSGPLPFSSWEDVDEIIAKIWN